MTMGTPSHRHTASKTTSSCSETHAHLTGNTCSHTHNHLHIHTLQQQPSGTYTHRQRPRSWTQIPPWTACTDIHCREQPLSDPYPPVQPSETHALTAVACFALDTLTDTMQGRTSHTVAHTHSPHLLTLLGLSGRLISEECFHQ